VANRLIGLVGGAVAAAALVAAAGCGGDKGEARAGTGRAAGAADGAPGATRAGMTADGTAAPGGPAAPTPSIGAECDKALAHMKKVAPDLVEGDEVDRNECMKFPVEIVICLQGIKDADGAESCVADYEAKHPRQPATGARAATPQAATPPEERATEDECRKAVANLMKVMPPDPKRTESEAELVKDCMETLPRAAAVCLGGAKDEAQAGACLTGDLWEEGEDE
jgi:hypothetical protein